jgi:hypothetical protein
MAIWSGNIQNINEGTTANDGTGDSIRDAFLKVDGNFEEINSFLGNTTLISFYNANVTSNFGVVGTANIAKLNVSDVSVFSGNLNSTGNLNASSHLYSSNYTQLGGNLVVTGTSYYGTALLPLNDNVIDLGSPSKRFATIYANSISSLNTTVIPNDSGLIKLHYAFNPASYTIKDIGVFGKYYLNSANSYTFFGLQASTNNFVYKLTNTDHVTGGETQVSDGVYGNVQIGSLFLSNTRATSSNTLIVAGDSVLSGNIYSAGNAIVSNLSVSGTVNGNLNVAGTVFSSGSPLLPIDQIGLYNSLFPAGQIYGNLIIANVGATNYNLTVTGAINTGGNITAGGFVGNVFGYLQTAAQPNITSLGRLTGLDVSGGTVQAGSVQTTTIGATVINATTLNLTGALSLSAVTAATVTAATIGNAGAVLTGTTGAIGTINAATVNAATIGNVGTTLTGATASVSGTVTATTVNAATIGNAGTVLNGTAGTIGTVRSSVVNAATIGNTGATLTGTIQTPTQTNITSVGTLTSLNVSGTILPTANAAINIGSTGLRFNVIYGVTTSARYADLAEKYLADAEYDAGTVVVFGGEKEITVTNEHGDERVAGAISTKPAYLMNDETDGPAVALRGRVPVKVVGPVTKGDSLVTSNTPGYAISVGRNRTYGQAVFAKALETDSTEGFKTIIAVIV